MIETASHPILMVNAHRAQADLTAVPPVDGLCHCGGRLHRHHYRLAHATPNPTVNTKNKTINLLDNRPGVFEGA